jgi:hypothetical protein
MESTANRTLVKSAPELWELADDLGRMEAWMAGLLGSERRVGIEVTAREPERVLAWRSAEPGGGDAQIALQLAEKGFGTAVAITARHSQLDGAETGQALERLLDELGSPGRRSAAPG